MNAYRPSQGDRAITVIGLGYVGLPLALSFLDAGHRVLGVDNCAERVLALREGRSPVDDVSNSRLADALRSGRLGLAIAPSTAIAQTDAIFVCVPTPVTGTNDPELGPVLCAARTIRDALRPGHLVVLQSTTFPGTTTGPFRAALEESGLRAGLDFDLAFAPERVNPGDPASASADVPRLVGGTTPQATDRAALLLEHINKRVVRLSSPDHAELAKLVENTFRNVNIALVNELAMLCERMELDVWEVLAAAGTKPFGFMRFNPGPGVGGHCIPVDPRYLSWRAREFGFATRFIDLSSEINLAMPRHVADLVGEALNEVGRPLKGARVGIVGVAFKPDVQDARNSPAADVIAQLRDRMAVVDFHDPHVHRFTDGRGLATDSVALDTLLAESDVICIVTAHRAIDWVRVFATAPLIVDTVNASEGHEAAGGVLRLGAGWRSRVVELALVPSLTLLPGRDAVTSGAGAEAIRRPTPPRTFVKSMRRSAARLPAAERWPRRARTVTPKTATTSRA